MLNCNRCKLKKPNKQFYKNSATKSGYNSWCKLCSKKDSKDQAVAARKLKLKRYGLTFESFDKLYESQNGLCAICEEPVLKVNICLEHEHKTNKLRGLTCRQCNSGLGMFKDDIKRLKNAIKYLDRTKTKL